MSKDKYTRISLRQIEAIVFIFLQLLLQWTLRFENRGMSLGVYSRIFSSFSWFIFGHVTHLDQSRAQAKIFDGLYSEISVFLLLTKSVATETHFHHHRDRHYLHHRHHHHRDAHCLHLRHRHGHHPHFRHHHRRRRRHHHHHHHHHHLALF